MTREECNRKQRERRAKVDNIYTKRYEKTKKGFLVRLYRNMKSRVEGVQKVKRHLYQGKFLLDKEDFYEWALGSHAFHSLFEKWGRSDYERRLTPSVDRIDPSKGYSTGNMEWVEFWVNCSRGAKARRGMKYLS